METQSLILIIEDDPDVAQSLRDGLQRNGYDAVWKSSGSEGLSYAKASRPHLIILDVRLPDGSGFDFCRQMREARLRQPILMLTVHGEESDKVLGLEVALANGEDVNQKVYIPFLLVTPDNMSDFTDAN